MSGYPVRRRQISVTLGPDLLGRLDAMVVASGVTRSQIIEQALEMWMTRQTAGIRRRGTRTRPETSELRGLPKAWIDDAASPAKPTGTHGSI